MRHLRVHIRPEAVFLVLQRFPVALGALVREIEPGDRLDRLEPVFPRQCQAQRRPVLLGHRLPVHPGHKKGELVAGLGHRDALDIGPGVPELFLAGGHLGVEEGFHLHVFRRTQRFGEIDKGGHREAAPRHRHRPCLDAAMAIEPLL